MFAFYKHNFNQAMEAGDRDTALENLVFAEANTKGNQQRVYLNAMKRAFRAAF